MKVGFIDYYLNEYHADHYPEWLREVTGEDIELYAWAESDPPFPGRLTTKEWCEIHSADELSSPEEVCEKADFIFVLAPDDPEKHFGYAKRVFPFGKPVFVDKTFATDAGDAMRIISLGERLGTPFFSSSSLRFAPEFAPFARKAEFVLACGGGDRFLIELIHPIEICACLMGRGAERILTNGDREHLSAMLEYSDGRRAAINFTLNCRGLDYSAVVCPGGGRQAEALHARQHFFKAMMKAVADFFADPSSVPVSHEDTLEGMRIRDGVIRSLGRPGEWTDL